MSDNTVEHVSTCLICWGGDGKQKDSGDKHCDDSDCLLSLECSTETPHMVHRSCLLKYFHHASDSSNPQFSCLACFRPLSLNFITRHFPEQAFLALLQKVSVPAVFWKLTNHDVCSIISDFLALPQTKGNHYDMRMTMMKFLYAWFSSKTMFAPTCAASSRSTPIHAASSRTLSSRAASSRAISSSAILEKKLILVIQACLLWNGNPDFTTASDGITEITNQAVALLNVLFSHPEIYPSFKHKMIKFICSLLQGKLYTQQHDEANQNEEQEQQHNIQEQYIQLGRKILALVSHNCADSIIQHGKIKLGELIMQAFAEQDYHGALLLCYRKLLPNPQTALEKDDDKVWEGILREIQALPPDITLYNLQNARIFLSYLVQGNMTSVQSAMDQMDRIWARYKNEASVQQEIFYFFMAVFGFCSLHDKRRVFSWLAESILPENFHAQIAYQQTRLLLQTLLYHHGREFMSEINTISARLAEEQQCLVDQAELYFQLPRDQQQEQERHQDYQAALPLLLAHVVLAQMMFTRTGAQYVKDEFILNLIDDRSTHDEMRIVGWLLAIQVQKIQPKQRLYLFDMPTLLDKLKNARSIDLVLAVLIYIHFADGLEHNREIAQILLQHYNALQVSEQYQFAFDMSLVLKEQKLLLPGVLEFVKLLAVRIQTQEENGGGADGRLVHSSVVGVLLKGLLPFLHACDVSWVEPTLYAISAIQFHTWNDCVAVFVSFILRGWFSKSQYETCLAYCDYNQEEEERRKYSRVCIPNDFTCIRNQLEAAWAQTSKMTWQVKYAARRMTTFFKNCFSKRKS